MRRTLFMATLLLIVGSAHAVIPPLDDIDKLRRSTHIVEGTIEKADRRGENDRLGTRWVTTLTVKIDTILKGEGLAPGDTIDLRYWQAGKRPERWVGDTGQRGSFAVGLKKRFFIHRSESGYHLLSPDGSETLERRPTFPYAEVTGEGWRSMIPADWSVEPAPSGEGTLLWPPEGETPTMSHLVIERHPDGCSDRVALEKTIREEVARYLEGEVIRRFGAATGAPYEIEYRWKDEPGQKERFVNIDRYVCGEGVGYRLRFSTNEGEYANHLDPVRIMFESFLVEP